MNPDVAADPLLLPERTRLVHIGPPKTATTTIQGAFHSCRAEIEAQGVHYVGRKRHSGSAVQAVIGRPGFFIEGTPPIGLWNTFARDARGSSARRVVISSEFFADALPESIPRIVTDLGPDTIHVVVTLRPLARILPSQWQQYVQSGMRTSYDAFLDAQFNQPVGSHTPTFWRRHRHDQLIERWRDVVGADRVTVVVLDEGDRDMVLRTFEQMAGLRSGTLVARSDLTNRSMTMPEIEAVRAFNAALYDEGLGKPEQSRLMHFGAAPYMRTRMPPADEPRVETPQWALDRVAALSGEMVDAIAAAGVRVIGDLDRLRVVDPRSSDVDLSAPVPIPAEIAGRMAMGVLVATGGARKSSRSGWFSFVEPLEVVRIPTWQLGGILVGRLRAAALNRLRRPVRMLARRARSILRIRGASPDA